MKPFSQSLKMLVTVIILVLLSSTLYYFLYSQIHKTNKSVVLRAALIDDRLGEEQKVRLLRNTIRETEAERSAVKGYLLSESGIVDFLESVEQMGERSGVEVSVRQLKKEELKTSRVLEYLEVSVDVAGTWKEMFHFLTLLESLPNVLMVEAMQLSSVSEVGEVSPEWKGTFRFIVLKTKE